MPEPFHLWDGLFHASTYIFTVLGLWILWRYSRPNHWGRPQALAFRRLQGREQCLCLVLWDRRRGFGRRCWRQQEKPGPPIARRSVAAPSPICNVSPLFMVMSAPGLRSGSFQLQNPPTLGPWLRLDCFEKRAAIADEYPEKPAGEGPLRVESMYNH